MSQNELDPSELTDYIEAEFLPEDLKAMTGEAADDEVSPHYDGYDPENDDLEVDTNVPD